MKLKTTWLLHDALKKIARWVLCFEAKSATKKFDEADTAQSENNIRFGAICHVDTPVCSMHTVE
jgi:hypothetical protein